MKGAHMFDSTVMFTTLVLKLTSFAKGFFRVGFPKLKQVGPNESNNFCPPQGAGIVASQEVRCNKKLLLNSSIQLATKSVKKVIPSAC